MSSKLLRVKDGAAKVITGTTANSDGFYYIYYIGFVLPDDTTCRLSEFYPSPFAAKEALAAGEYTRTIEEITYQNGTKLYYPVE